MLAGWYPGYSIGTYGWNSTITDAVNTSLTARGNGTVDSNTGWEKVWRVACWAQLNNTDIAYALSFFLFTLHSDQSTIAISSESHAVAISTANCSTGISISNIPST
jgi:hypothetical protein